MANFLCQQNLMFSSNIQSNRHLTVVQKTLKLNRTSSSWSILSLMEDKLDKIRDKKPIWDASHAQWLIEMNLSQNVINI